MDAANIQIHQDPVADTLDDMAALCEHWQRNRARGRTPNAIRAALLLVAREAIGLDDHQRLELGQMMSELCGVAARANRNPTE